jgi:hypothetical protein
LLPEARTTRIRTHRRFPISLENCDFVGVGCEEIHLGTADGQRCSPGQDLRRAFSRAEAVALARVTGTAA